MRNLTRFHGAKRVLAASALAGALAMVVVAPTSSAAAGVKGSGAGAAPPAIAAGQTAVSIQFDDGYADQLQAMGWLSTRGMNATFFINSGFVGTAGRMSWDDLHALDTAGNEIAGHTIDHVDLKKLKPADATAEVCGDRDNIMAQGFAPPVSFAYPFGSFDSGTEQIVASCGYASGRGVSGVNDHKVFAEAIPPLDPYATRTPPNVKKATKLSTMQRYVTDAESHGGGWIQIVFHHICTKRCDAYSVSPEKFQGLLDWLQQEVAAGRVVVETTRQVMGT